MVIEHVPGVPLSEVDGDRELGAEVRGVLAAVRRSRFDRPGVFRFGIAEDFRDGFVAGFVSGPPLVGGWLYLGCVLDTIALGELVTRPGGNPVADQAAGVIRRWLADGLPRT